MFSQLLITASFVLPEVQSFVDTLEVMVLQRVVIHWDHHHGMCISMYAVAPIHV